MNRKLTSETPSLFYYRYLRPGTRLTEAVRNVRDNKHTPEDAQVIIRMLMQEFGMPDKQRIPLSPFIKDCGFTLKESYLGNDKTGIICTGKRVEELKPHAFQTDKVIIHNVKAETEAETRGARRIVVAKLFVTYLLTVDPAVDPSFICCLTEEGDVMFPEDGKIECIQEEPENEDSKYSFYDYDSDDDIPEDIEDPFADFDATAEVSYPAHEAPEGIL